MASPDLETALAGCCTGPLAPFAGGLRVATVTAATVPATALLDAAMRDAILKRFATRFDAFEPRAVYSIWTKWHLAVVLPPVLIAGLLLDRRLSLALNAVRFTIGDDARTSALVVPDEGTTESDPDPFHRYDALVFGYLAPLFRQIGARTGLTQRVLWSNAASASEAILRRVESATGPSPNLAAADRLLATPHWPDGRANPLHGAVEYAPERRRRVCCLQYLLPDRRFCSACPVERDPVETCA